MKHRWIGLGIVCVILAGAPLTSAQGEVFSALRDELQARATALSSSTDKNEIKQYKACLKAIAAIDKSTSLKTDIKTAGKIAKSLSKVFTNEVEVATVGIAAVFENNLYTLIDETFANLIDELEEGLDVLGTQIEALPSSTGKDKALALYNAATALLDQASDAPDYAALTKLLGDVLKNSTAATKAVLKAANSGGGTGNNSLTMKINGSSWTSSGVSGAYNTLTSALLIGAASANPPSQISFTIQNVTAPGTYALQPNQVQYLAGFTAYLNTGGTITFTTFNVGATTTSISGTFAFSANGTPSGSINVTQGAFTINNIANQP